MMRNPISAAMFGARAQQAVPAAYSSIVSKSVLVRPMRSATRPKMMPPAAQVSSSRAASRPVHS